MKLLKEFYSKKSGIEILKFVLVGILNTGFSYGLYAGFVALGINYQLANFIGFVISLLFSFKMQGSFVFKNNDNQLLVRFALSWVLIYSVVTILIGGFVKYGFNAYLAGALALPFSVASSYIVQKYYVFRRKPSQ